MKQKINIRLSLVSLIAIVATVIGLTCVYYNLFQQKVRDDLKQNARLLVETGVFQTSDNSIEHQEKTIENLSSGNLRITWINENGKVIFDNDTDISGLSNHMDRPEIQMAVAKGEGESTRHSDTMNMDTFYYALLLENGTILRVSTQAITVPRIMLTALPVILVITAGILTGCVLIGHLLIRQLMKPLEEMADNLDQGDLPVYKELEPFMYKIRSQHENILAVVKSRQDFTANISHELKTPITAISGYAELIENRLFDKESEIHIARQIRHNADRLLSLITDIIQLSELDHGELPRTFDYFDLLALAEECVKDCRPQAQRKRIHLVCSGFSAGINADRNLIREMVDNLIQNAIRYNVENGKVEVSVYIKDEHPILSVKDTGIGISADHQERIFERFYRVDKSRSRERGGTGLGLAIVKHIADIHSARIDIDSIVGQGTEITVSF